LDDISTGKTILVYPQGIVLADKNVKYICCNAMAHVLRPMASDAEMVVLDIALHLNPARLRERLCKEIVALEEEGLDIVLGYGLCGRALEGVGSSKSRLILPKVDDCVGALLGSRQRHQSCLHQRSGCYFLEPAWLGTELDMFNECMKGLDHISEKRKSQLVRLALKNYSTLAVLSRPGVDSQAISTCMMMAQSHGLVFMELASDHGLLQRLAAGDWDDEDFVLTQPGQAIPFF